MISTDPSRHNIGPRERRKRLYAGLGALLVGVAGAVFLLIYEWHPLWRLTLFVPFWMGALSVWQYKDGV